MKILAVSDMPIKTGYHLHILQSIFNAHGIDSFGLVSVLPHMTDKELKKIKPEGWLAESDRILKESKKFDKILCLGAIASATVFKSERSIPVTRIRGRGFLSLNGKYTICTFAPSTVIKDADFFRDLCFDIEKLITHEAPMPQPDLEIQMVETYKDLSLLKELHGASFLACDIETTSLNPFDADILGIGFAALEDQDKGYVIVVPEELVKKPVLSFLKNYKGTTVFHNAMFDTQHLWKKFGRFEYHHLADTMLMNWCLDERPFNRYRSHGLDLLQRLYFDVPPKRIKMVDWLEEYYRKDVGDDIRWTWVDEFCSEHAEMARTAWREWHQEVYGEEPEWRGLKVGRDIPVEDVYDAIVEKKMHKSLQPPPDEERKTDMWEEMLTYMGEDCFSTARLYPILKAKMEDESPRLMNLHDGYLMRATYAFAQMRNTGAKVNVRYLRRMKKDIEKVLVEEMDDIRAIVCEFTDHPKGPEFNPNSSKQVKEVLYNAGDEGGLGLAMPKGVGRYAYRREDDAVTTNSDTLKVLARQVAKKQPAISKLINLILSYRVKSKIIGTYIDGILDRVDPDERIRGEVNLHGTATARVSASNPNLQNIPDASHVGYDIRKAYIPSDGWVILEADHSQLELRVAALFSQDEVMLEAYRNGADIHQEVAYMLWKKPKDEITKYERYLAKCMNFGVIYGRGARSIATGPEMDNLVEMSGRSWSNAEIDAYFAMFKQGYGDLFRWMDLVKKDSMRKKYVENPLGHRRRFDLVLKSELGHVERQTVNTPIQGFAAQITIDALCKLDKKFDPEKQRVLFTVHDSIMCECRREKKIVQETADIIKDTMENDLPSGVIMSLPVLPHAPFSTGDPLIYNLPFVADVSFGKSWGECYGKVEHMPLRSAEQVLVDAA